MLFQWGLANRKSAVMPLSAATSSVWRTLLSCQWDSKSRCSNSLSQHLALNSLCHKSKSSPAVRQSLTYWHLQHYSPPPPPHPPPPPPPRTDSFLVIPIVRLRTPHWWITASQFMALLMQLIRSHLQLIHSCSYSQLIYGFPLEAPFTFLDSSYWFFFTICISGLQCSPGEVRPALTSCQLPLRIPGRNSVIQSVCSWCWVFWHHLSHEPSFRLN